jgi:cobyrinic acid a,c-diamide synthase
MRAFVVAGTHSGVGKTTLTLGLLAALHKRGQRVQGFKVGPDFIDPGHHAAITGTPSFNLDGWMLSHAYNQECFARALQHKDIGVIEGMMGLFDGYDGKTEAGSTAEMAKWLDLPVILVVDASAMARSVAALVHGFQSFDPGLNVAGVIFNRIGGKGHLHYLQDALADNAEITVLGGLPSSEAITIPERHLGLVTPQEHQLTPDHLDHLATFIEDHLDLDLLLQTVPVRRSAFSIQHSSFKGEGRKVRLGVARDAAFCFYYPDNLALLEEAGAELVFFSPLRDKHLPIDVQGLYFGGGYPELHAQALAANTSLQHETRAFVEGNGLIYAECGGFMYLTEGIRDLHGTLFPMVGIYPTVVRMLPQLKALGYVEVSVDQADGLFPVGQVRGHEFHYSELENVDFWHGSIQTLYTVRKGQGDVPRSEGYCYKRCLASYVHLHFGSKPAFAAALVAAADK